MKIEHPCQANFNSMLKVENGRHCNACNKTVVDFTTYTELEIKDYLVAHQQEEVCGRFKNYQLQTETSIERIFVKFKNYVASNVHFSPIRLALLSILTGILGLATSCMGAVQRPMHQDETNNSKIDNINKMNAHDTIDKH